MSTNVCYFVVERRLADGTVGKLGSVRKARDGYRFNPSVFGYKASRKGHPTLEACLPKWVGYPDRCETREVVLPVEKAVS